MTATDTHDIDLGDFEGSEVLGTTIKITNAGDGLSQALEVAPVILHKDDVVHVVLECRVEPITFKPVKDTHGVQRVHTLKAGRATIIDGDLVGSHLDEQQRRIEEAEGTVQLPFEENGDGRGGEPQTVGQVLDDAIDLAQDAEDGAAWRRERTAELDAHKKAELIEMALEAGVDGASTLTKPELVDAIVDAEEGDGVPF